MFNHIDCKENCRTIERWARNYTTSPGWWMIYTIPSGHW
jgi:hypothetical protein